MATTKAIEIRTEIPGPRSRALLERERLAIAHPADRPSADLRRARGERDDHGRRRQRLRRLRGRRRRASTPGTRTRGSSRRSPSRRRGSSTPTSPSSPIRRRSSSPSGCARSLPISGEKRAAFFNAGTEAVENAVKLARLHTGRPGVIAYEGAFHGRTLLSMTMTSKFHPYKTGMGPFAPEVYRAPFPDAYRGPDAREALGAARADARYVSSGRARRGDRDRAAARRGWVRPRLDGVHARDSARSATAPGSCSSPTRCRPASAGRVGCSRWSTSASSRT